MHKTLDDINALKARWMTGSGNEKACPQEWEGLDELSLLALAGQFSRIATRPVSPGDLQVRPDIPSLPLPTMPPELRPQFRRILSGKLTSPEQVVSLITARGYCVNPIDWMPKRSDVDLPRVYDSWRDWLDGNTVDAAHDVLSAETWDSFPAHSRYSELTVMHGAHSDAARGLIATVAPTLPAEQRLRMLECLRNGLSGADKPLLETFSGDRSSKVQAFVKLQLARLGHNAVSDREASAELTDFIELQRAGMLSRRKVVRARKLKNDAQRKRRKAVLGRMSLQGISDMLDLDANDIVEMWDFGGATDEIAEVIATSGTDDQVDRFAERLVEHDTTVSQSFIDRVSPAQQRVLGLRVMMKDDWRLAQTMPWFTDPDGSVALPQVDKCDALTELIALAVQTEKPAQEQAVAAALNFLGLIAAREAAASLVERLTAAGVMTVDHRLTLLRLNAAL